MAQTPSISLNFIKIDLFNLHFHVVLFTPTDFKIRNYLRTPFVLK